MPQKSNRSARIEARISPDVLAVLKRAAEIQGRSVSEFVVDAAREAAHRTIDETSIIHLSVDDQRRIAASLLNPPEPNGALRRRYYACLVVQLLCQEALPGSYNLIRWRLAAAHEPFMPIAPLDSQFAKSRHRMRIQPPSRSAASQSRL